METRRQYRKSRSVAADRFLDSLLNALKYGDPARVTELVRLLTESVEADTARTDEENGRRIAGGSVDGSERS